MNISLVHGVVRMAGQRNFRLAAVRAARAVFGDFLVGLIGPPENITRCERCRRPFVKGQMKLFCSKKCARGRAVTRSHAGARLKKMRNLSAALRKLLEKPVLRSNWVNVLQMEAGLTTKDGRLSKIISQYMRAAKSQDNGMLLNRLTLGRTEAARKTVEKEFRDLLGLFVEAQRRENKRKIK
jgi:hypothetical protein